MRKTRLPFPFYKRVFGFYTFECTIRSLVFAATYNLAAFLTVPSIYALCAAANIKCVDALIGLGVDVNEHPNVAIMYYLNLYTSENTPLESALENGNLNVIRSLLQAGAAITRGCLSLLVLECEDVVVDLCLEYMNKK